jgi:flagellar basal body rod protein FlgC
MSDALSVAVNGLNASVSRATQFAGNIVKASSTGKNLDGSLVGIKTESVDYAANATVIKTEEKLQKALLDIKV